MAEDLSFGRWLQQRRRVLDLTQAELARRVSCAKVTIQKIELEERRPSKEVAERLAEVLQIAADERSAFLRFARGESSRVVPALPALLAVPVPAAARPGSILKLPRPATPLIGREREVLAVRQLLERPTIRLLTLTGPGGIGKTRLALQLGFDLRDHFRDGVCFVPLAAIRDPELVASTLAQRLEVQAQGVRHWWRTSKTISVRNTCCCCWTTSSRCCLRPG